MENNHLGSNRVRTRQNSGHQKHKLRSQDKDSGSTECSPIGSDAKVANLSTVDTDSIRSNSGKAKIKKGSINNARRLSCYGKKVAMKQRSIKYKLRSSSDGVRVLRSMSKGISKAPTELSKAPTDLNSNLVNPVKGKQKRRRNVKNASHDVVLKTRKRVRYLLTRMNYEQNLIDAYSGEGWKGQSLEKIKPEMELQRARSEIRRCKLKIREVFQHLDSSISEGKLDDTLFDSEGEIFSEDIFCAQCSSKEYSTDNDIILCDGICDRGFHQKCLNPPMLSENIPTGDDGWLCPGCDCKVDCIDLLNEFYGTNLSIEDKWEKVFPEAVGDKKYDDLGLSSDDSEDNDYNPDGQEVDDEISKHSSSDDSDFISEDSGSSNHAMHGVNLGLPSDDSEDTDYDPDKPGLDEKIQKDNSSSDESDFTSDTDDLDFLTNENLGANDTAESPISKCSNPLAVPGERSHTGRTKTSVNFEFDSLMGLELGQDDAVLVSGKRHREDLDYKRLHDEAYGNTSSDSSDDEDWTEMSTPKKVMNEPVGEDTSRFRMGKAQSFENQRTFRSAKGRLPEDTTVLNEQIHVCPEVNGKSLQKRNSGRLQSEVLYHSVAEKDKVIIEPDSNGNLIASSSKKPFGSDVLEKLRDYFKVNKYPSRDVKENLAKELGIAARQVGKWFENARHSLRISTKEASPVGTGLGNANIPSEASKSNKAKSSNRSARERNQVRQLYKSHGINVFEDQHDSGSKDKKKEAIVESSDRQRLVLRELRKRRKSM